MRTIKNLLLTILIFPAMMIGHACKKQKQEDPLRFHTDAPADAKALGSNYVVWLAIDSPMPEGGVEIQYTLTGEADNLPIPQGPVIISKLKSTSFILMNIPRQKYCVCKITVRSRTNSTNVATSSFRIVYK